ncbi:MAG TPA: zf-HC2 domain-containing protein [Myxococcota bacterium]|nr:zf-HC2 domain-containing protein [Myxococcota bacterium]HRY92314.1 zf-HC2 domain-containing protein [Myxococcota bacterium]HSA22730.1 zf-HC2 domain-containing protein [Myxococcota bacterium]
MTVACSGQPISWLALERYQLDELGAEARSAVEAHLAACPACRGCLERIRADGELALPPLPLPAQPARPAPRLAWLRWAVPALGALAAACLLWLAPWAVTTLVPDELPGPRVALEGGALGLKGGELALDLVRERAGAIDPQPAGFAPGDRFRALVTCPPPAQPYVELVVYQDAQASFPGSAGQRLACGNQVALPGAFRLTGAGEAHVCVVLSEDALARAALEPGLPGDLLGQAACVRLPPSP